MAGFTIKVATDNTAQVLDMKDKAVETAMAAIALKAEAYGKINCPVDTGRLRNSITGESDEKTAQVGTNTEYGPYVEMGTSRMTERPFIKPAIENHLDEYKEILQVILSSK